MNKTTYFQMFIWIKDKPNIFTDSYNGYDDLQKHYNHELLQCFTLQPWYDNCRWLSCQFRQSTWKCNPDKRIIKSDVEIAKNYLTEKQIKQLERNVAGFFDYLEDLIDRATTPFTMKELADLIDKFLSFREYKILNDFGSISKEIALEKAHKEYEKYNKIQKSHFEELKKIAKNQKQKTFKQK